MCVCALSAKVNENVFDRVSMAMCRHSLLMVEMSVILIDRRRLVQSCSRKPFRIKEYIELTISR